MPKRLIKFVEIIFVEMKTHCLILLNVLIMFASCRSQQFEKDTFQNKKGELVISFIGHGTLMIEYNQMVYHIDPWSKLADYHQLPKADFILLTHHHPDHLDKSAINILKKEKTIIIGTKKCQEELAVVQSLKNGESAQLGEVYLYVVPAYNVVNKRNDNQPFHPRGEGNGYVIDMDDLRIYIAGDTENIPEMKSIKNVDIAFLPCNLPYTMTPEMFADAVKMINPKVLYPYHYGDTDLNVLKQLLKNEKNIDIRIRKMK